MTADRFELRTPHVLFGPGSRAEVPVEVDRLGGRRVLLVADAYQPGVVDDLVAALGSRLAGRAGQIAQHVPVGLATATVEEADRIGADLVVSFGGGSATGLAKLVARERGLPIVAVPTTYAGSEMTPIWGQSEGQRKTTGRDSRVLPRTAIYDPELTVGMPAGLTAVSGMNAIAHAVESLYAPDVSPLVAMLAEEAIRSLGGALPGCVDAPSDLAARCVALRGAWLAGLALGNTTMGLHHRLCHVLGGFGLPHGETHAAVLPYTAAYNAPAAPAAMRRIAAALGVTGSPGEVDGSAAAAALWQLGRRLGTPVSLVGAGFDPALTDEVVALLLANPPANPRPVRADGVRDLLAAASAGQIPAPEQGSSVILE
ncbi:MAG TPA: maleylacetate reductase [Actinomycetes bacterium]|nr:maleylacetate reductase [Actinomycetes bacterium]